MLYGFFQIYDKIIVGDDMTYSSQNRITNSVIRLIGEETMNNVEQYVSDVKNRSYKSFNSLDEAKSFFDGYMQNFYFNSNLSDIENIKYYTGPSFKEINAVLRNNWNYEVSLYKNPTILFLVWKIFFWIIIGICI